MGYRIKTVSKMIGVPRNTLLAWERRYQVVEPARLSNGYREYSEDDVIRLRELKSLLDSGHRISEAMSLLAGRKESTRSLPRDALGEAVLAALLRLDRTSALALIRRSGGLSYTRQLDDLYFPMLKEVGRRWASGSLTVAQEHFISHFCREQITAMLLSLEHGPADGPKALCAVYPDDPHDLPLLGLSVKLALSGHRILFLGARTPIDSLLEMILAHQPDKVCVSITLPVSASALLLFARSLSTASHGQILFGGAGLPRTGLTDMDRVSWIHELGTG